jgi:transcriptional regulator with XRE-family HTH domain
MDDVRVGRFIRACRIRLGWRQLDLAARAGVSQQEVSLLERGHLEGVPIRTLRIVLRALDASVELDVRWRGGAIDRLLDERHASLEASTLRWVPAGDWDSAPEVSYSVYGERGAIDVLAWRRDARAAIVFEVKSQLTSIEATLRKHDEKGRLAPRLVRDRVGWTPGAVARVLVLPDTRTSRRHLDRAAPVLDSAYPMRARELRMWVRSPVGSVGAVLLLTDTSGRGARRPTEAAGSAVHAQRRRENPSATNRAGR